MKTINEYISEQESRFRDLSVSRQKAVKRKARRLIEDSPGAADHGTLWRGLSARQVLLIPTPAGALEKAGRRRQSLADAVAKVKSGAYRCGLDGLPEGGWAETVQARIRLLELIPSPGERSYVVDELIAAVYTIDSTGRYRYRF